MINNNDLKKQNSINNNILTTNENKQQNNNLDCDDLNKNKNMKNIEFNEDNIDEFIINNSIFYIINKKYRKPDSKIITKKLNEKQALLSNVVSEPYFLWTKNFIQNIEGNFDKNFKKTISENRISKEIEQNVLNIQNCNDLMDKEYKDKKIKGRKIANVFIIIFSILIVGLFFLYFLIQNNKIIKKYKKFCLEQDEIIKKENEIKKNKLIDLFSEFKRNNLLNKMFDNSFISPFWNTVNSNVDVFLKNNVNDCIGIHNVAGYKIGKQNVYLANVCQETIINVVTSNSITVPYIVYVTRNDGNGTYTTAETRYEIVTAYHSEPTPKRSINSYSIMKWNNESIIDENGNNWYISLKHFVNKNKKIDYLKSKKIATNKKQRIENIKQFENPEFNLNYHLTLTNPNGSIEQENNILAWFTVGAQEKLINFKYGIQESNDYRYIEPQVIFKESNYLILENNYPLDLAWFYNKSIIEFLAFDPLVGWEENYQIIKNKITEIIKYISISSNWYLLFPRSATSISINPIENNYTLSNKNYLSNNSIDSNVLISIANIFQKIYSNGERKLIDNLKCIDYVEKELFCLALLKVDNYYTTNEIDPQMIYAPNANKSVLVNVPYVKYHPYSSISCVLAIKKTNIDNNSNIYNRTIEYINKQISVFEIVDDFEYTYIFINDINDTDVIYLNNIDKIISK